jgi:hypothetical protein
LREHATAGGHFLRTRWRNVFERRPQAGKSIGGKTKESKPAGFFGGWGGNEYSGSFFLLVLVLDSSKFFSRTKDENQNENDLWADYALANYCFVEQSASVWKPTGPLNICKPSAP